MEKVQINMVGGGFQAGVCSSAFSIPKYIEWNKGGSADISIHIDEGISAQPNKSKRNFAWIAESSAIITSLIGWVHGNIPFMEENYELIFTHDQRLLPLSSKMRLVICNATPWIGDPRIHEKTKLVSMIASNKTYCPGHFYRQEIIKRYSGKLDLYGTGHNPINRKEEGLNDYCFSIAMENDNYPNIFCEKITDCFATGTIPIYWGTPTIGEFFNENGIITLTENFKVEDLSKDLYLSKMEYIKENFE